MKAGGMALKFTLQGGLIYLTMFFFLATALTRRAIRNWTASASYRSVAYGFWSAGFIAAAGSVVWRGIRSGHAPLQNLFDFFLCMAMMLAPFSLWNRLRHGLDTVFQDACLGLCILFPAGFILNEEIQGLMPALQSPLFVPHVAAYVTGYVMMARAALLAWPFFSGKIGPDELKRRDQAVRQTVAIGFVLVTAGLLLGSIWGKICWGHYWQWDPKEMWSLATWFVYAAFFHYRRKNGLRSPRGLAALLWTGLIFIILTLTWINISRLFSGLHTYAAVTNPEEQTVAGRWPLAEFRERSPVERALCS